MIAFKMLAPPSTNALYTVVDGIRIKTRAYKKYVRDAGLLLNCQKLQRFTVPVEIKISLPANNRKDIDNTAKSCIDTLKKCAIIPNDSPKWVKRVEIVHAAAPPGPDCIVTITPWEEPK